MRYLHTYVLNMPYILPYNTNHLWWKTFAKITSVATETFLLIIIRSLMLRLHKIISYKCFFVNNNNRMEPLKFSTTNNLHDAIKYPSALK